MRAREFIIESKLALLEGLMKLPDWSGPRSAKYINPFLDNIEGQIYAFNTGFRPANKKKGIVSHAGKNFEGTIVDPLTVKANIKSAMKTGNLSGIVFSVNVVDEDTSETTGEVVHNVRLTNIYKDEKIKGEIKPNMGNVTEALLGCAVAAKFVKGGGTVTEKDLADMGRQIAQNGGVIQAKAGKDTLEFKVSIPFMDKKAFYAWLGEGRKTLQDYKVPQESIDLIERRSRIAVEYANTSERVAGAIQAAQDDPRNNKVDVISDGGEKENQSTTKVDLRILVDGQPTAKRLLSVKAGDVAQFGQVVGSSFEHVTEFFSSFNVPLSPSVKKYFYEIAKGARGSAEEKKHNFDNGMLAAYEDAGKKLKAKARTDQAGLVEDVYQGLLQHLTRKEEGVEMVILDPDDKKAFRELSFGSEFEKAVRQLQLVVVENMEGKAHIISIYGYPIGSIAKKFVPKKGTSSAANKLVDLKSQFKDGTVRNMTAMGGLLKDISDIANYIEKIEAQPQQQKQPAAATPAPAQGVKPAGVKPIVKTPTTKPLPTVGQPMGKQPIGQQAVATAPVYPNQ
jgi:hypothetical protein